MRGPSAGPGRSPGVVAGLAGLATSYFVAMAMTIRESPVVSVAELVIRLTPGPVAEGAISVLGKHDKPFLVLGVLLLTAARLRLGRPARGPVVVGADAGLRRAGRGRRSAVMRQRGAGTVDLLPVAVGFVTWLVALLAAHRAAATGPRPPRRPRRPPGARRRRRAARRPSRPGAASCWAPARWRPWRATARRARSARGQRPAPRRGEPRGCCGSPASPSRGSRPRRGSGWPGIAPWMTPPTDFYRIHTAIVVPAIEPARLAPAHPRPGRPRDRLTYQRPAGPRGSPRPG